MLKTKLDVMAKLEVRPIAAQPPNNASVRPVDLVYGARMPGRQQIMTIITLGDGIDMKIVPRCGAIVGYACLTFGKEEFGFCIVSVSVLGSAGRFYLP